MAVSPAPVLLERRSELRRLEDVVAAPGDGRGRAALVEGAAGIGKTSLLRAALASADAAEALVLTARGGELERELRFSVVRELFEAELLRAPRPRRRTLLSGAAGVAGPLLGAGGEERQRGDEFSLFHGLYWLCANLAEERRVVLAVDDAHLTDRSSIEWLAFLCRRLHDLPVAVLVSARTDEAHANARALEAIATEPATTVVPLAPLGAGSVAQMLRAALGAEPEEAFVAAFHEATGGNPFFTGELIRAMVASGMAATAQEAPRILEMTPGSIARMVLQRLEALPAPAAAIARAVAVLGTRVELRHAAAVARVDPEEAAAAADMLVAASIFAPGRPLSYAHPVLRAAVATDTPAGARAAAQGRAARLLASEGAAADRVAAHLLSADSIADSWVVDILRAAAEGTAPEAAVAYLRRALEEPPPAELRGELLIELGEAETLAFEPLETAIGHLRAGLSAVSAPAMRARAALALSGALMDAGDPAEARMVIDAATRELEAVAPAPGTDERELLLRCEAMRLTADDLLGRPLDGAGYARLRDLAAAGETPGERVLLANLAYDTLVVGATATEAHSTAEAALQGGCLLTARLYFDHHVATWALEFADELAAAERYATAAVEEVRQRGSAGEVIFALTVRGLVANRRGALRDAEADLRTALQLAGDHGLDQDVVSLTYAALIDVLTDRGALEEAEQAIARCGFTPHEPANPVRAFYFHARGRERAARARFHDAVEDFRLAGRMMAEHSIDHPAFYPWRSSAALAMLARGGDRAEAASLTEDELRLARTWGARRSIGAALRVAGLVRGGADGLDLLHEAVTVLELSPAALERARALVDLGAALRRAKRRTESRAPLLAGLDLAHRCGAPALEARAREELAALGARPRRALLTGVGSLTASELRVAKLAADGLTNRQIAQSLFISMATVEKHLGAAYRKLDVGSRSQLPTALRES